MPRRRSASPRPASRSQSRGFGSRAASPPPPAPRPTAPPPARPQQQGGGMMAGLAGTVAQGMAFGTGSAMAHRAVDAVLGSRHPEPVEAHQAAQEVQTQNMPCSEQAKSFSDCMNISNEDMEACRVFFDRFRECRLNLQ